MDKAKYRHLFVSKTETWKVVKNELQIMVHVTSRLSKKGPLILNKRKKEEKKEDIELMARLFGSLHNTLNGLIGYIRSQQDLLGNSQDRLTINFQNNLREQVNLATHIWNSFEKCDKPHEYHKFISPPYEWLMRNIGRHPLEVQADASKVNLPVPQIINEFMDKYQHHLDTEKQALSGL